MRFLFLSIILLNFSFSYLSAQNKKDSIKWISIDDTKRFFESNQKPILFYFYHEKEDSCRLMSDSVFALKEVFDYINILFYPVKFNVESKEKITFFDGTVYENTGKYGKIHDFVIRMLGENPTFPSFVCFNREAAGTVYSGFRDRNHLFPMLIYYTEDAYKSLDYETFEKYYFKTFPPGTKQIVSKVLVKWKTFEEAEKETKLIPKKILVSIYANWRVSSTMMSLTTFNNPKIAKYLNEKYYSVNLDAQSKDTINAVGVKYINEGLLHGFHQLPIAMLEGKMIFPAFFILDENLKVLEKIQLYMTPEQIEPILYYFGEDAFKSGSWQDYKANFKSKLEQ